MFSKGFEKLAKRVATDESLKETGTSGHKLLRVRKDGTIGPLFINRKLIINEDEWMAAESHPTKGYAFRPGWHATLTPVAPHLSTKGREWREVELKGIKKYDRPESQGGTWLLAEWMKVKKKGKSDV